MAFILEYSNPFQTEPHKTLRFFKISFDLDFDKLKFWINVKIWNLITGHKTIIYFN